MATKGWEKLVNFCLSTSHVPFVFGHVLECHLVRQATVGSADVGSNMPSELTWVCPKMLDTAWLVVG